MGWASPHNPKIQGSSPSFVTSAGPTQLSPQRYQRWRRSCAAVVMVGPDGSFLAREILAGCYKQRVLLEVRANVEATKTFITHNKHINSNELEAITQRLGRGDYWSLMMMQSVCIEISEHCIGVTSGS